MQVPVEKKQQPSPEKVLQQNEERKRGRAKYMFFKHKHFQVSLKSKTRQPGALVSTEGSSRQDAITEGLG